MSVAKGYDSPKTVFLLPRGWKSAPRLFWKADRLTALVFFVVNFLFGTVGIWLPLLHSILGARTFLLELTALLDSGALYFYAIAFLATISGTTFTSLARDKKEHTRSTKIALVGCSSVSIFICTIFLQVQLGIRDAESLPSWVICANYLMQFLLSVSAVIVAVYVHSLIFVEETGSPKSDIDQGAAEMLTEAYSSTKPVQPQDFQS